MPEPTDPTLADQQAAIAAMFSIAWVAPDLPAAFISIHTSLPAKLTLAPQFLEGFEEWRQVIGADPQTVDLHVSEAGTWLSVSGEFNGIGVELSAHFVLASQDDALEAAAAVSV